MASEREQVYADRDWWRFAGDLVNLELRGWTFRSSASFLDRATGQAVEMTGALAGRLHDLRARLSQAGAGGVGALTDKELCDLAEKQRLGSVAWAGDPDQFNHLIEFTPASLREFIASLTAPTQGDGAQKLLDKALNVLGRCHTVLFNMARENEGAIFNRWPIHHEPLRSDARNLLPLIDEVLGHD